MKKLFSHIIESLDGYVRIINHIESVKNRNTGKRPLVISSTKLCKKLLELKGFEVYRGPVSATWGIIDPKAEPTRVINENSEQNVLKVGK